MLRPVSSLLALLALALAGPGRANLSPGVLLLLGGGSPLVYQWTATAGMLGANMTLSRAGAGTYYNSAGVLSSAGANAARFDCPNSVCRGLLFEPDATTTNFMPYSNGFTSTDWTSNFTTLTSGATLSPDGTSDAWKLNPTTSGGYLAMQTATSAASVSMSFRAGTASYAYVGVTAGGDHIVVDLSSCSIVTNTGYSGSSGLVDSLGGGWCRVKYHSAQTLAYRAFQCITDTSGTIVAGSYCYVFGGQAEVGKTYVSSYISTNGSTVTRAADGLVFSGALAAAVAAGPTIIEWTPESTGVTARSVIPAGSSVIPATGGWLSAICVYRPNTVIGSGDRRLTVGNPC